MLVVRHASMGSSKPPNQELLFGYTFDDSGTSHPYPSPTAPAPGPSLLDDNESRFLDNFFDGVSSDQFNYDVFNTDDANNLGIGWDDIPPNPMGNTSSYVQHPQTGSHGGIVGLDFPQVNTQMVPNPAILSTTANEVLQAANLLQNGLPGRNYVMGEEGYFRGREEQLFPTDRSIGTGLGIMSRPLAMLQPVLEPRSSLECYSNEPHPTNLIFDGQSAALTRNRGVNLRADIRWGSDAAFATPQGFTAPSSRESVSAAERYHLQTIETAFSLSSNLDSAEERRCPSSDLRYGSISHQRVNSKGQNCIESDQSQGLSTNKGRNIEGQEEEEDDDFLSSSLQTSRVGSRKRKFGISESTDSSILEFESSHRRKRSTTSAGVRSTRENLTEEQKRENHIRSEQKRRTLIREGFEDLNELVPGLQGGGYSKSAVLAQAADWLENLIRGNETLRTRILMMEGQVTKKSQ
ncbi:putative bhlh family transcription factor protein [Erysiphe necator]|uniref:Putative bhlh family transcription factor protein n=1 Tax=Uncinula necator TaxID=52586 RepID=A0A0B1P2R0_UNCNE|nr:putative bhlh family transcription factor protein [Erysiphe necator]